MLKRIHFQTVGALDVERARDFYRDKLGFQVRRDDAYGDSRWVFLALDGAGTLLHFDKRNRIPPQDVPELVLVADDVDATCRELEAKGVTILEGPEDAPWEPGGRWAYIADSEGNKLLIQTVKE